MDRTLTDRVGIRGEACFTKDIVARSSNRRTLFRPAFLGEKKPVVDFYVELLGSRHEGKAFIVSVKATELKPVRKKGKRYLPISIPKAKVTSLLKQRIPAYIAVVDSNAEKVYIFSTVGLKPKTINSILISHPLLRNLDNLRDEVAKYWDQRKASSKQTVSRFI